MVDKSQTFLVTIAILEGRHYAWMNMDSAVIVKVHNKKRCTSVRYNSDGPYYNEYFVFEFFTTYEKIISKNITITVIQPRSISRKRKILGYFTLDVATVWSQKNHQFYHKWAILSTSKSDVFSGPRGYIKVDISILAKGEVPNMPIHIVNDEIEGNLLLPEGSHNERLRATYEFDVFRCENLVEKPSTTVSNSDLINNGKQTGPTTYIEISFAGLKVRTSVKKNTCFPIFNEKLKIVDLFPPLCQRIKIDICHGDCCIKKHIFKYINLKLISNDKEEGFLPTFGPTFLHMYFSNILEGYAGSVIMSMHTRLEELVPIDTKKSIMIEPILPLNEQHYFHYQEVLIFTTIFEASAIQKKYCEKLISFRITFGGVLAQKYLACSAECTLMNATIPQKPMKISKNFGYMDFDVEKPMLIIDTKLPFFKRRIFSVNILSKIARDLKQKLDKIEDMFQRQLHRTAPNDIDKLFIQSFDHIATAGRKYIDIVSEYNLELSTDLDKERACMCIKEMNNILDKMPAVYNNKSRKKTFGKLQNIYRKIEALIIDIQDCWPDVFLWMVCGNKKVAYFQIQARDIAFSPVKDEMGYMCGIKKPVCLYSNQKDLSDVICRMEVMFWLGLEKHKKFYLNCIPEGFKLQNNSLLLSRRLIAEQAYIFQLRAYVFQGKISAGFDQSGLADTFVRVLASNQQKETQTINVSLSPSWNEMLIFNNIIQYGSKAYIRRNALMVVLEVFDRDRCGQTEFVGRCSVKPIIKFLEEPYAPPDFPPKLHWYKLFNNTENLGEVLAAFELLEIPDKTKEVCQLNKIVNIPQNIIPKVITYRIEVLFWGVRDLKKVNYLQINRPRITIICGEDTLISDTIENAKKNPNFSNQCKSFDVIIPSQSEYVPPLCMKLHDSRRFGVYTYAGVHISSISDFLFHPMTVSERMKSLLGGTFMSNDSLESGPHVCPHSDCPKIVQLDQTKSVQTSKSNTNSSKTCWLIRCFKNVCKRTKGNLKGKSRSSLGTYELLSQDDSDSHDFDWWTKFYDSLEKYRSSGSSEKSAGSERPKLMIYPNELERQPEFKGFTDMLTSFEIYKGKRTGDETVDEENITAIFKGGVKIYPWPPVRGADYVTPYGSPLANGVFHNFPANHPLRYLLRVYCVRAIGLTPKDLNGKADPYLRLTLGEKTVTDKENAVVRQLDPVFGRYFEFNATFPIDHTLMIAVWDRDTVTSDDLIGETKIDLENRFFSKHRALCGIPENYDEFGYCEWRDYHRPSTILLELCKKWNISTPEYTATSVSIGFKEFYPANFISSDNPNHIKEVLALTALRRWQEVPVVGCRLVPEHVETRSLYNSAKPGIEQGKLQIWIDMFPLGDLPPPRKVDICPRKPVTYELRVIIWNTDEVQLNEDDFFLGEKKSDIFVKGWLVDSAGAQQTDVHYRSLTGEGNFNWRFIFRFDYLSTENRLVVRKKDSIFSNEVTEHKIPCKLILQVWDNDTISMDDFIGTLTLELSKMPRGARVAEKCNLSVVEQQSPTLNLFKVKRTKGWWPFKVVDIVTHRDVLTGKVEAELEILTAEEADNSPAGLGRREPQALPLPNRPDVSFSWFRTPLKALNYVCCKLHRCKLLISCLVIILVFMGLAAIYAIPGYTMKRILGAR